MVFEKRHMARGTHYPAIDFSIPEIVVDGGFMKLRTRLSAWRAGGLF
jgi:hypothetical protein